jgi:trehalose-phosphatase
VRVGSGKQVLEVRPFTGRDKGKATLWVLRRFKVRLKTDNIVPVYMGDDWTDESAFKILNDKGVTIFVGGANPDTTAQLFLRTPKEVGKFLGRLARIF